MKNNTSIPEDVRKIHSSVNQIDNQRITLVTAAITMIGLVLAWFIPKSNNDIAVNHIYAGTILLFFFLFIFFILSRHLRYMHILFVEYLKSDICCCDLSHWEKNIARYRDIGNIPLRNDISHDFIFFFLGIGITFYPFLLKIDNNRSIIPMWLHFLVGGLYCVTIFLFWFFGRGDKNKVTQNWDQLRCITANEMNTNNILYNYPFFKRNITLIITKHK